MTVIDSYRILEPYGRDLDPEAYWLESFGDTVQIWLTWKLAGGEEVAGKRPLNMLERISTAVLLERAKYHGDGRGVGIQLAQGYDTGEAPARWADLSEIIEMYIEVRG